MGKGLNSVGSTQEFSQLKITCSTFCHQHWVIRNVKLGTLYQVWNFILMQQDGVMKRGFGRNVQNPGPPPLLLHQGFLSQKTKHFIYPSCQVTCYSGVHEHVVKMLFGTSWRRADLCAQVCWWESQDFGNWPIHRWSKGHHWTSRILSESVASGFNSACAYQHPNLKCGSL